MGGRTRRQARAESQHAAERQPPVLVEVVDDSVINDVFEGLTKIEHTSGLDLALGRGKLIIERLFGGSVERWRARDRSDTSLRRLSDRFKAAGKTDHPGTLSRDAGVFAIDQAFGVATWQHLDVSHFRTVAGLPPEKQRELLDAAQQKNWTVAELRTAAKDGRKSNAGRKTLPAYVKGINALATLLKKDAFTELEHIPDRDRDEAERLLQTATAMHDTCGRLVKALHPRVQGDA